VLHGLQSGKVIDWPVWLGFGTLSVLLGMLRVVHSGKRGRVTGALTVAAVALTMGTCFLLLRPVERRESHPVVVDPAQGHSPQERRADGRQGMRRI
jgi:hypothetical protein